MFFARGDKSVQRQRIFADVGMNQEVHFGVQLAERGVRRQRHLHEVAHAAHVQEHLIRSFFGKAPAKLANHRSPVLPLSLRPSTRHCEGRVGRICDLNRRLAAFEPSLGR